MPETFNPYRQWLELSIVERPHSDYELLGLPDFEPNAGVINTAADKAIAKVRSHRPGDQAAAWSRLLDELNGAKKRLSDAAAKQRYDDQLRSARGVIKTETPPAPTTPSPAPAKTDDYRYPPGMGGSSSATATPAAAASVPTSASIAPVAEMPAASPAQALPQPVMPQQLMANPMMAGYGAMPMASPGMAMPMGGTMPMAYAMPMPGMPMQAMPMMGMPMTAQPMGYGAMPMNVPGWGYVPANAPPPVPPPGTEPAYGSQTSAAVIDPMAPVVSAAIVDPMAPIDPMAAYGPASAGEVPLGTAVADGSLPVGTVVGSTEATEVPLTKVKAPTAAAMAHAQERESSSPVTLVWGGICIGAVCIAIAVLAALNSDDGTDDETQLAHHRTKRVVNQLPRDVRPAPQPRPAPPTPPKEDVRPMPKPEDAPKDPMMTMKPVVEPDPMPKPREPMPDPTPPKPPEPAPKPPEPEKPLPTKEQVAQLAQHLAKTRLALSEGNMEDAKVSLAAAEKLPKLAEHEAMYERMAMLVDYNGQFWDAIDMALKNFKEKGSNELMVGSQVLLVVEVRDNTVILRVAGRNRTYNIRELPGGIAVAMADKWFDQNDPAAKVMKGAYAAVNKAGNVEKAKAMWDEAIAAGVDIKALPAVIDDKYDGFEKDLETAMAARKPPE